MNCHMRLAIEPDPRTVWGNPSQTCGPRFINVQVFPSRKMQPVSIHFKHAAFVLALRCVLLEKLLRFYAKRFREALDIALRYNSGCMAAAIRALRQSI